MPLFLDRHNVSDATAKMVADAHQRDLDIQDKHGTKFITYWFDEGRGTAFCLVEAPNKEAVENVHRLAHGQIPSDVIAVDPVLVEVFLGRLADPTPVDPFGVTGNEPISESAFRAILFTDIVASTHTTNELGDQQALDLVRTHNRIVRGALSTHGGREVKHTGDGIMASFSSVRHAVECAVSIQRAVGAQDDRFATPLQLRIGLSAGEPIAEDQDLFGATVQLAARLCSHAKPNQILVSSVISDLCIGKRLPFIPRGESELKGFPHPVQLFEVPWRAI